jgi:hypothetical protein
MPSHQVSRKALTCSGLAQALALGEAGHDLERVAEDHAVRPILVVGVELGFVRAFGDAIEVSEEVGGELAVVVLLLLGLAQQVVDEGLGADLFLNVKRRGVDDEVAPVLLVLATPDELGIEVAVSGVTEGFGGLLLLFDKGLLLDGGDVFPIGIVMVEGGDLLGRGIGGAFLTGVGEDGYVGNDERLRLFTDD